MMLVGRAGRSSRSALLATAVVALLLAACSTGDGRGVTAPPSGPVALESEPEGTTDRLSDPTREEPTVSRVGDLIRLPPPRSDGPLSVEAALRSRRSVRHYSPGPLSLAEVGQLLWAAQGVTSPEGLRTAPSAGALYPLEVYLAAGEVTELAAGVYKYRPADHTLALVAEGDVRFALQRAALDQSAVGEGAAAIVIAAVFQRTTRKYGERGIGYVHAEAGAAAENVYLQAEALGLGTVYIGAFYDDKVRAVLSLAPNEQPLVILPVGRR